MTENIAKNITALIEVKEKEIDLERKLKQLLKEYAEKNKQLNVGDIVQTKYGLGSIESVFTDLTCFCDSLAFLRGSLTGLADALQIKYRVVILKSNGTPSQHHYKQRSFYINELIKVN